MVLSYHKEDKNSTVLHQKVLKKIFFIILSSKVHKLPQKTMIKLVALHDFCLFIVLKMFHMKLSIKLVCFTWNIIFAKLFMARLILRQCFIWNIVFKKLFWPDRYFARIFCVLKPIRIPSKFPPLFQIYKIGILYSTHLKRVTRNFEFFCTDKI